jgi:serine/threonine protein phosphatase 1
MMENGKVFIIGDVHGCLKMLKKLMDSIDWRPETDRLIFLGDYIDRGEDSRGVISYILGLLRTSSLVECLMGNHEILLLNFLAGGDTDIFLLNGGITTLESYQKQGEKQIPRDHLAFFQNLRPCIELEDYYVVHAGFRPGVATQKQNLEDILWIRESFIFSDYDFGKKVIFGHTPFAQPLVMDNKIGLDTGAVYGNQLTCLELPCMKFHSVGG